MTTITLCALFDKKKKDFDVLVKANHILEAEKIKDETLITVIARKHEEIEAFQKIIEIVKAEESGKKPENIETGRDVPDNCVNESVTKASSGPIDATTEVNNKRSYQQAFCNPKIKGSISHIDGNDMPAILRELNNTSFKDFKQPLAIVETKISGMYVIATNDEELNADVNKSIGWYATVPGEKLEDAYKAINSVYEDLSGERKEFLILNVKETGPDDRYKFMYNFMVYYYNYQRQARQCL
jgi:hypothetical protein